MNQEQLIDSRLVVEVQLLALSVDRQESLIEVEEQEKRHQ